MLSFELPFTYNVLNQVPETVPSIKPNWLELMILLQAAMGYGLLLMMIFGGAIFIGIPMVTAIVFNFLTENISSFEKNEKMFRGLYIFNVPTIEEAEKLVVLDPAVKAGVFVADMTLWYGSASLMATPELHKKLSKTVE